MLLEEKTVVMNRRKVAVFPFGSRESCNYCQIVNVGSALLT